MPLPLLPAPDRPHSWARGAYLPAPCREWRVEGYPGYRVLEGGTLIHDAHTDPLGRFRKARKVKMRCVSGCFGFTLRNKNGAPVWVGLKKMKKLLYTLS